MNIFVANLINLYKIKVQTQELFVVYLVLNMDFVSPCGSPRSLRVCVH